MHELILGGGKSGKSRCAESRAKHWLQCPGQEALLIATALPGDEDMRERIARHRAQRAVHVPTLRTMEVPHDLAAALREHCAPQRLVVVDCLTLWLVQHLMPLEGAAANDTATHTLCADLVDAVHHAAGPVVLVSNEIGMGVAPPGRELRRYLDALGALHQRLGSVCGRVTLMVAGIEMKVKG